MKCLAMQSCKIFCMSVIISSAICSLTCKGLSVIPNNKLFIFAPGEKIVFHLSKKKSPASVEIQIVDWNGKIYCKKSITALTKMDITLPALPNGYYELRYKPKNTTQPNWGKYSFAVIPFVDNRIAREKNPFGGMVIPHGTYSMKDRLLDARLMQRIGMRWVRTHRLNWSHIQKSQDSAYDWRHADAEVNIYRKYGIDIVATICWPTPGWASSGYGKKLNRRQQSIMSPAKKHMAAMKKYCTAVATRYRGKIGYYEIGNEVDAFNFWLGSYEHFRSNDTCAINKDFYNLFIAAAVALKEGDPGVKVAPGTTGAIPEGATWKPWLKTMYKLGIAKEMNAFSTHYMADVDAIRAVMRKYGKPVDIIFTEIGGFARNVGESRNVLEKMMLTTTAQYTIQYSKGGKAMCKFLLRDIPAMKDLQLLPGLLRKDFSIRPNFVAYATLVRMLVGSDPIKELNITSKVQQGWLQGFAFKKAGKILNVIWLNGTDESNVVLESPEKTLELIDIMGRSRKLLVKNGKISFKMRMPVYIIGKLNDDPGKIEYPKPKLIKTVKLKIPNAGFEIKAQQYKIPGWKVVINEIKGKYSSKKGFRVFADNKVSKSGQQSLCLDAKTKTKWWGVLCRLPMDKIPEPKAGQYVEFIVNYDQKGKNIVGIGSGVTFGFRKKNMHRVTAKGGNWERGNFDWTRRRLRKTFDNFHPETEVMTLEFYLGLSTGTVWFDNIEVEVKLWQKSLGNIDIRY
jgi:Glycosyl hydrolase family 10